MTIQQGILTGITCFVLAACSSDKPAPDIISQDAFVEVYVDLLRTAPTDTSEARSENARRILGSHGVSPEEFRAAVQYYNTDPEKWKPILDEVVRRLEEEQRRPDDAPRNGSPARSG
jgi:Domain of unknown function (DUF4296)